MARTSSSPSLPDIIIMVKICYKIVKQTPDIEHKNAKATNCAKCESCGKMAHALYYNSRLKRWEREKCYFKNQEKEHTLRDFGVDLGS